MATFTVVMRTLTMGQSNNLKQCLFQSKKPQLMKTILFSGIGSQLFPHHKSTHSRTYATCMSICPSSHSPAVRFRAGLNRNPHRMGYSPTNPLLSRDLVSLNTLSISHLTNLRRTVSTSQSDTKEPSPAASESVNKSTDSSKEENSSQDGSEKDSKKESWWRGKNSWRLGLIFLGGTFIAWGIGLINIWGAPQLDPEGNEILDEFSEMSTVIAYLRRTWKEMNIFKKKIQDPSRDLLLPDPLKYPYMQPPYTLVIELTGVLIHPDWTYNTGWRFKKRPGIDYFLQQVGPPLFEVVIYSQEAGMTADPLVNHLDPQGYIMYRLYRDATRYMDGKHVKDLSCLNREMSKVIMIDCNKDSVSLQPRNSFVLNKWVGEDADRTLIDLAHFLKTIATSGVDDIRPVLDYYCQFDDPLGAFKDNQRKLEEEEEARKKRGKDESQKRGWLASFGFKR